MLTEQEKIRYSRHIFLPEIQEAGQEKFLTSKVLIVGLGGLGSAASLYLAASGIGQLYIADNELIELSNLQRQILYVTEEVGQLKTKAAKKRLQQLNPEIKIEIVKNNLEKIVAKVDVVVDCSDNFSTRFMLNKLCVQYQKPLVSGSAIAWEGQIAAFDLRNPDSPCYACLYPELTAEHSTSCEQSGVVSPVVGIIGSYQALAVINIILDRPLDIILWRLFGKTNQWRSVKIVKDQNCAIC